MTVQINKREGGKRQRRFFYVQQMKLTMATTGSESYKYLLNRIESCVDENLAGQVCLHPGQRLLTTDSRVVIRADIEQVIEQGKVSLLCGGGAGHEPAHAGKIRRPHK